MSDPVVLVLVGTDVHPFNRLISWLQQWVGADDPARPRCLVQFGTSAPPQAPLEGMAFLPHAELQRMLASATAVVCHGGPATITECRRAGRVPIVVPRDPALGEHVDGHQQRFARMLGRSGLVRLAETQSQLRAALDEAMHDPAAFAVAGVPEQGQVGAESVRRVGDVVDGLIAARRQSLARASGRTAVRRRTRSS